MKKILWSSLVSCISLFSASAQIDQISISPDYNIPLEKLSWTYKPGLGIQIGFFHLSGRVIKSKIGLSLGYTVLPQKSDTLYYVVDNGNVGGVGLGKAVYSPFKLIQIKVTIDYKFPLVKKKFYLNAGGGLGVIYGIRSENFTDSFGGADGLDEVMTWAALIPRAGFEYQISDHFSLEPFFLFTLIVQTGSKNVNSIYYNANTGLTHYFCSTGLSLNYSF